MPLLNIKFNTSLQSEKLKELTVKSSKLCSRMLGKPESFVMVGIEEDKNLQFAGSLEPCAYIELKSLGLDESATRDYSLQLCRFLQAELNLDPARIYIEFKNAEHHMWGWNNSTF